MKNRIALSLASAALLVLAACGSDSPTASTAPSPAGTEVAAVPSDLFSTAALPGAVTLLEAKASARPGDTITFHGAIAGRVDPFTDGRAVMLVADPSLPFCDASHGCPTPWDACCEPADVIARTTAAVQVVDAEGRPLKAGLNGMGGLEPGKKVEVEGLLKESGEGFTVVNATRIHVLP